MRQFLGSARRRRFLVNERADPYAANEKGKEAVEQEPQFLKRTKRRAEKTDKKKFNLLAQYRRSNPVQ